MVTLNWLGGSPHHVTKFRDQWLKVVDNLALGVQFDDVMLRDILFQKMEKTANTILHNDLAHYRRGSNDHTDSFLATWRDRYFANWTMEQNQAVQESDHLKHVKTFRLRRKGREGRGYG